MIRNIGKDIYFLGVKKPKNVCFVNVFLCLVFPLEVAKEIFAVQKLEDTVLVNSSVICEGS